MWCVAPLEMIEGNSLGQGYNRPTGCSAEKAPHATFNFNFNHCVKRGPVFNRGSFNISFWWLQPNWIKVAKREIGWIRRHLFSTSRAAHPTLATHPDARTKLQINRRVCVQRDNSTASHMYDVTSQEQPCTLSPHTVFIRFERISQYFSTYRQPICLYIDHFWGSLLADLLIIHETFKNSWKFLSKKLHISLSKLAR